MIEDKNITHGSACLVWVEAKNGWAIPGGQIVYSRRRAEHLAAELDKLIQRKAELRR